MSYSSNSFTSTGASNQSGRYIVPAQAIQPAISTHQHNSARIHKIARGDRLIDSEIEWDAVQAAFSSGQMSTADFNAAVERFLEAGRDQEKRIADFTTRKQAGQTKPADVFKALYGYTDEEAEDFTREGAMLMEMQMANEARNKSRMAQRSTHGRGH
ncbi:hypothetical protein EWM64_g2766 [Hericium alpestre]|uniref:Uncharacterized protein n=1 Tax=Hericium alpestre TaxID=135208 RepID=A0A4Z0A3D3_9AGAM|nr:hypothetical protein EWM64_g2766 [Hericium alpestre]